MSIVSLPVKNRIYYEVAIIAIDRVLGERSVHLPGDFLEILLESSTPRTDLKPFLNSMGYESIKERTSIDFTVSLVLAALEAIHDQWRIEHLADFFDPHKQDEQYALLPFYLVGFNTAIRCCDYVTAITDAIDLSPTAAMTERFYTDNQRIYLSTRAADSRASLRLYLSSGADINVAQSVAQVLHRDPVTLDRVVAQVAKASPKIFTPAE